MQLAYSEPLLYTAAHGGRWIAPKDAVLIGDDTPHYTAAIASTAIAAAASTGAAQGGVMGGESKESVGTGEGMDGAAKTSLEEDKGGDKGEEETEPNARRLARLLCMENIPVVVVPPSLLDLMKLLDLVQKGRIVSPELARTCLKEAPEATRGQGGQGGQGRGAGGGRGGGGGGGGQHACLEDRGDAVFLLRYCLSDLQDQSYGDVVGLPLVPVADGGLGTSKRNEEREETR